MEEEVRRNIVVGFFDTIYWSRRFRREIAARRASRMGGPLQMTVPEIFVEDPDDSSPGTLARDFTDTAPLAPGREAERRSSSSSYDPGRVASSEATLRRRDSRSNSPSGPSPSASPHLAPQGLPTVDTSYHGAGSGHRSESPGHLGHSPHGSTVSALGVLDSLDNSAWGESIRRSFTMRRPNSSSQP